MQGVVMAGGQGERLRPLTYTEPKSFLPVAGHAVVEWGLMALQRAHILDVVVTTAYKREVLVAHLGDGSRLGLTLRYAEEKTPLGTAGGVKNAQSLITGPFVVMSADVVSDIDVAALVARHKATGARATIGLTRVTDTSAYGIVGLDNDGRVTRFFEKPKPEESFSDLVSTGIYVVEREVLDLVPKDTKVDFARDVFPKMVGNGLFGHVVAGYWKDVGRPEDLLDANRRQCERLSKWRFGKVTADPTAQVEGTAIMDGVHVGADARCIDSLLLSGVQVGPGAVIERCILGRNVKVGARAELHHCVIGSDVTVPDGARWAGVKRPETAPVVV